MGLLRTILIGPCRVGKTTLGYLCQQLLNQGRFYDDILSAALTNLRKSNTGQVQKLIEGIEEPTSEMIGDGDYDSPSTYKVLEIHQKRCN